LKISAKPGEKKRKTFFYEVAGFPQATFPEIQLYFEWSKGPK
jgi:hypothetical protein